MSYREISTTEISGTKKIISFTSLFYKFSFILCMFPYAIRLLERDLQPLYFIVLGICLVLSYRAKTSSYLLLLLLTGLSIIIYRLRFDYGFVDIIRSLPIYLTPIFLFRFFEACLSTRSFIFSAIRLSIYIYVMYASLQIFGIDILGMNNEERVASGRGYTSLTNEPSMFGFILTLLMASMLIGREETRLDWSIYAVGMLLCGSASALICSIPLFATLLSLKFIAILVTSLCIVVLGLIELNIEAIVPPRLIYIIQSSGLDIFLSDHSINERVGHLAFIFSNPTHFLIGGIDGWGSSYLEFLTLGNHPFFFGSGVNNILSGIGGVIFDGGILGIFYILLMIKISNLRLRNMSTRDLFICVGLFFVAIQSVSFANPLLTLPLACNALVYNQFLKTKPRNL
jgi:hypothetical protein